MSRLTAFLVIAALSTLPNGVDAADPQHGDTTAWGKIVDPDRDCGFRIGDDSLSIRFGIGHHAFEVENDWMNSPRVLRSIDGDFSVHVTVDGNLPLPDPSLEVDQAYISGALVVMQDDLNYIRLERASFNRDGQNWNTIHYVQRINGQPKRIGQFNDFPLPADGPVGLKFEVRGGQVLGLARRDREGWHQLGTAKIENRSTLLVGVSGVKTVEEEAEVSFRKLRFSGEDPTLATYSTSLKRPKEPRLATAPTDAPASNSLKYFQRAREIHRRSMRISEMTEDEHLKLMTDAKTLAIDVPKNVSLTLPMNIALGLADGFDQAQMPLVASDVYRDFAAALEATQRSQVAQKLRDLASRAEAKAKHIGTAIELKGPLIDGTALDWREYQGKIVLIDFWASWSATHSAEVLQMKDLYQQYRDQGFEIVGICLDQERGQAEAFIEIHEIPWPNLFSSKAGWEHPMARRFDVKSVPTAILVDRDSKIVSMSAQGNSLNRLLSHALDRPSDSHEISETTEHGEDESQSKR